ncbi:hypothetical protein B9Z65_1173 [Elsinoe australis]|uniref:Uncharacterized protein n=1 Tax=Elsinoe australis TaxID=40998 RepID=A0A2P8AIH4_9PEZI|nr:hypothetical protein B9Z65_1173 [Elsinoe australis]
MPPNNSPQHPSPRGTQESHTRPLTPLSYLSSPVPDLAATLVTQTEADAHDENLRFLRNTVEPPSMDPVSADSAGPTGTSAATQTETSESSRHRRLARQLNQLNPGTRTTDTTSTANIESQSRQDTPQRDRMMRVLSRLSRFDESGRPRGGNPQSRQEETSRQSDAVTARYLVDEVGELREIIEELRRQTPGLAPEVVNIMARSRLDRERETEVGARRAPREHQSSSEILSGLQRAEQQVQTLERRLQLTQRRLDHTERHADDLRSTAIMQNARTSANTTERMLRYIQQREQLGDAEQQGQGIHDPSLLSRWTRYTRGIDFTEPDGDTSMTDAPPLPPDEPTVRDTPWGRQQNLDRYRREYLSPHPASRHHHGKPSQTQVSPFLENAVRYLDRIRDCTTYDDALSAAIDTGFANKEFFADKHDDFLMDVSKCQPLHYSSWLQSGVRFSGSQHTTFQSGTGRNVYHPYMPASSQTLDATRPIAGQVNPFSGISDARMRSASQPVEHWPVKVMLHLVDQEHLTLSGTMEAYDVPSHSESSTFHGGDSEDCPITTFLEGQIIDLQTHSFLTPTSPKRDHTSYGHNANVTSPPTKISFPPTSAAIDAANWRRLPPFADEKDDDEVARVLLSHDRMAAINEQYIFMRWKERCFIHRQGDRCPISPQARRASLAAQQTTQPETNSSPSHGRSQRREGQTQASHQIQNANLNSARYVTEASFSQPVPRFPRPSQEGAPFPPPENPPAATNQTPELPAPPSTEPGPGPSIIAHIPPTAALHTSGQDVSSSPLTARPISSTDPPPGRTTTTTAQPIPTQQSSNTRQRRRRREESSATVSAHEQARSRPTTTIVLGEGDDTDTGHGLTISGFYYISLCRATGELTGLYWDPGTSPYQCLRLKGERGGGIGSWNFT